MAYPVHICLVLFVIIGGTVPCADAFLGRYVSLICDLYDYYSTSGVNFLMSYQNPDIRQYTLAYDLTRRLSKNGVAMVTINSEDFENRTKQYYYKRAPRPLVVLLLTSIDDVNYFSQRSRKYNLFHWFWLIIFANDLDSAVCEYCNGTIKNIFHLRFDSNVLVVCCEDPLVKEWWAFRENSMETAVFGRWTIDDGLELIAKGSLYERRSDLNGTELRIAIVTNSVFLADEDDKMDGYFIAVMTELKSVMNFDISLIIRDERFGSWNSTTRNWSGIIGKINRGEADLGVGDFTITTRRLEVVDFTLPLMLSRTQVYLKTLDGEGVHQWFAYFKAFGHEIWLSIILLTITTTTLMALIKTGTRINSFPYHFFEQYLRIWGIFCQQTLSEFPVETPLRIAYFSVFLSAIVVLASYSASLTSFLAVTSAALPFSTIEEYANDGSYRLIVVQDTSDWDFVHTSSDPVISKMMTMLKPLNDLPRNIYEALEQLCADERVGFIINEAVLTSYSLSLPCKISKIETGRMDSFGMIMPAGSQYTDLVNYHIHHFQSSGIMSRLKDKYLMKLDSPEGKYHVVCLRSIAPILFILASGIILSLVVLLCEKLYKKFGKSARMPRKIDTGRKNNLRMIKILKWYSDHEKQRTSKSFE